MRGGQVDQVRVLGMAAFLAGYPDGDMDTRAVQVDMDRLAMKV